MRLLRLKLSLTLSNRTSVDGTHGGVIRRIRNRNGKVVKDPRDSRRKDELIAGRHILIMVLKPSMMKKSEKELITGFLVGPGFD